MVLWQYLINKALRWYVLAMGSDWRTCQLLLDAGRPTLPHCSQTGPGWSSHARRSDLPGSDMCAPATTGYRTNRECATGWCVHLVAYV